jgi:hypothetical protein
MIPRSRYRFSEKDHTQSEIAIEGLMAHTFVLVHGAWLGGWCWQRVADRLRVHGHAVFTPTLTGLGERSHLVRPGIDLATHVSDAMGAAKRSSSLRPLL